MAAVKPMRQDGDNALSLEMAFITISILFHSSKRLKIQIIVILNLKKNL